MAVTAALVGLAVVASAQTVSRIVTVDMQKIFDAYYKTPTARGKLEQTRDKFTGELKVKQEQLKKSVEELNQLREDQDRPEYTAEVKEQKRKALNDKLAEIQRLKRDFDEFRQGHQKILEDQSTRMRQSILREITDVVATEAKGAGYTLVMDRSGNTLNGIPTVLFAQDATDITDNIIKILNKNAPAPAPAAPAAAPAPAGDQP
ncbi:OmpH family outer membrane protein [bacterium]|nr:OmpH family outer membrane protein [bacterium]